MVRPVGYMGPLHIPASEILAYAMLKGIQSDEDLDDLMHYLVVLDRKWLSHHYEEVERKREADKKKPKPSR